MALINDWDHSFKKKDQTVLFILKLANHNKDHMNIRYRVVEKSFLKNTTFGISMAKINDWNHSFQNKQNGVIFSQTGEL